MDRLKTKLIYLISAVILLLLPSGKFESIDGLMYLNTAKSIVYEGNFSVEDKMPGLVTGVDGKAYSAGGLGWTLVLTIPVFFYKILGGNLENLEFLAGFINPLLAFGLLIILVNLYTLITKNKKVGFTLAMLVFLSTNLVILAKHSFALMLFILTLTAAFYFGLKYFTDKKGLNLALSGLFYGLLLLSYNYSFVLPTLAVLTVLLINYKFNKNINKKFDPKLFFKWLVWIIPFILILFSYNYLRFGNILESGYGILLKNGDAKIKAVIIDGVWGLLLSPGKSLWVYSPVLLYSLYLSLKHFRKSWLDQLFLIMLGVNIIFYSNLSFWSGELSYGPRYLAVLIPFGGLVLANHWKEIKKIILLILVIIGFWVQFVGLSVPYTKQYEWYDMEFMCVGSQGLTRKGEFDYWNIGEFIPRFSPPYRLKRKVFTVWKNYLQNQSGELPDFWWIESRY